MTRLRILAALLAVVLAQLPLAAAPQGGPRVSARLSTGIAKLGAPVELVVTVEGTVDAQLGSLPAVPGLRIGPAPGASTSQTMQSRNGRMVVERRVTWRIPVRAEAIGDFEIPAFEVVVEGRRYPTSALDLRVREDLVGAELGIMQVEFQPTRIVAGQPFDLILTFGWDANLAGKINHADLSLPWWGKLLGTVEVSGTGRQLGSRPVTVNLNGRYQVEVEALGVQEVRGKPFEMFRLQKSYLATHAGTLELPTSHLEFGRMSQGGFFENPRPIEMYYVAAASSPLEVGTLPEASRPFEYTGAVGSIEAIAVADRRDVDLGDSIKLKVEWRGDGNLEFFDLPDLARLEGFEGFRSYGATDQLKERFARVSIFDLAPIDADVTEIPAIPLWVFDPETRAYELVETRPIPIRVRALTGSGLEDEGEVVPREDIRDIDATALGSGGTGGGGSGPVPMVPIGGSALGLMLAWGFVRKPLRRGLDPTAPLERRRRRALAALRKDLRQAESVGDAAAVAEARHAALCRFLGARTREDESAWVGRDPMDWRGRDGTHLEPAPARELADCLGGLERAAFGPEASAAPTRDDVLALAKSLTQGAL
ncbi:MAG: BatD family protein [Planctomycetota bacterium]|nr:BatD family protein [Planctomycetota bacterium]